MKKIKTLLINISKKNSFIRMFLRRVYVLKSKLSYLPYKYKYRMNDNMIFFEVYGGRNYTCSPKAIYEKLITLDEFKDYSFIWAFNDIKKHDIKMDKRTKIIKSKGKDYYKYISMSKYWIVNSIIDEGVTKKSGQIYVQCWHGTPLKKLRCDITLDGSSLNSSKEQKYRNDIDSKRYDYFLSPSKFCTKVFNSGFNLKELHNKNIIIEEGYPRNDSLFFNNNKEYIYKIKNRLGVPKDKKIILYLPTFRDNQHNSSTGYTYNLEIDFSLLRNELGKEYIILFKPHYLISNKIDLSSVSDFVYNVCDYDEVNDLYLVSDILLTDYSSVFFDFANTGKPMLFYMYDLDEYKNNLRDFYFSIDELPGPISKTQDELLECIKNVYKNEKQYSKKYKLFNEKYNYLDDCNSSERVIKKIFKL